jgi:DedD protein
VEVSTKERLTGALIVVLAIIVVAPELLSGRHEPAQGTAPAQNPEDGAPLQTFSVQLDASGMAPPASREIPAAAAAEIAAVPPPITEDSPAPVTAPASGPKPATSIDSSPGAASPARTQVSGAAASAGWWVQLGSFESRANAQRLAQQLRDGGFAIEVSQGRQNGKDLYRVRAGPVADREAAKVLQARLVAAGQKNAGLVAP